MVDIDIRNKPILPFLACGLLSGLVVAAPGCDGVADFAKECGLVCPVEGVGEGNANISGVVSIDAFFGAVITVRDAAATVSGTVRAELEGIAVSLEIEGYAAMGFDELAGEVETALQAKFQANLQGGLTISYEAPKCEASLEVAVTAAAECDVEVEAGSIEAHCMGSCEVSADVAADCQAMGTLECTGQAPNFECSGTCSGTCQLEVAAECSGSCTGECSGECSAYIGGGERETDAQGNTTNCAGSCEAMCTGSCELEAAASCSGRCEGECTYNPGNVECEAGASASCDVSAMAEASCEGSCEGSVEPPSVSAECEASVEAKANAELTCTPPSLNVEFSFAAGLDAEAQAEFRVWLEGFKGRFAAMASASAKLDGVQLAAEGLITASGDLIPGVIADIQDAGGLDLKVAVGLKCALTEVEFVGAALGSATTDISASLSAFAVVGGAVGAGG